MFGYIRPYKAELKIKDFTQYRAIYCGLCKTLKRDYGEIPRLATNYDLTFMAVLLLAFHETAPAMAMERCIANPLRKHGIAEGHEVLDFTAATAVLLAAQKMQDNIDDKDNVLLNKTAKLWFKNSVNKAKLRYPDLGETIAAAMHEISALESETATSDSVAAITAPERFGSMLADIFELGLGRQVEDELTLIAIKLTAADLGRWIYYVDAIEDYEDDLKKKAYNALQTMTDIHLDESDIQGFGQAIGFSHLMSDESSDQKACSDCGRRESDALEKAEIIIAEDDIRPKEWLLMKAARMLQELESSIDRQLALLTYKRFGDLVANVVCEGLYEMRMTILRGQNPGRL